MDSSSSSSSRRRLRHGLQGVAPLSLGVTNRDEAEAVTQDSKPSRSLTERIRRGAKRSWSDLLGLSSSSPKLPSSQDLLVPPHSTVRETLVPANVTVKGTIVSLLTARRTNVSPKPQRAMEFGLRSNAPSPVGSARRADSAQSDPLRPGSSLTAVPYREDMNPAEGGVEDNSNKQDFAGVGSHLEVQHPALMPYRTGEGEIRRFDLEAQDIIPRPLSMYYLSDTNSIQSTPRSTFNFSKRTSTCTSTSSRTDSTPPASPNKRYSNMSGHASDRGSIASRVFSTVHSIASSVTTNFGDRNEPVAPNEVQNTRLSQRDKAPQSRPSSSGTIPNYFFAHEHREEPLPITPSFTSGVEQLRNSINRSSGDWVANTEAIESFDDQFHKRSSSDSIASEPTAPPTSLKELNDRQKDPESSSKLALSIIDEGSDAATSFQDNSPVQTYSPGRTAFLGVPSRDNSRSGKLRTVSEPPSSSTGASDSPTPGTSIDERPESDTVDTTDDGESFSDASDEEEDPFLDAFAASPLDPALLPSLLALRDRAVDRIECVVTEWLESHTSDQPQDNPVDGSEPGPSANTGSGLSGSPGGHSQNSESGSRKRAYSNDGASNSGNAGGDDEPGKRHKKDPYSSEEYGRLFACPFTKRYPDRGWPGGCTKKGWREVRRVKEHIYRNHRLICCARCFAVFKTDDALREHERQTVACTVAEQQEAKPGVTDQVERQLRSRKGKQGMDEKWKWDDMYRILFPGSETIPSAYFEPGASQITLNSDAQEFIQEQVTDEAVRRLFTIPQLQQALGSPEVQGLRDLIRDQVIAAFTTTFQNINTTPTPRETPAPRTPQVPATVESSIPDEPIREQQNSQRSQPIQGFSTVDLSGDFQPFGQQGSDAETAYQGFMPPSVQYGNGSFSPGTEYPEAYGTMSMEMESLGLGFMQSFVFTPNQPLGTVTMSQAEVSNDVHDMNERDEEGKI